MKIVERYKDESEKSKVLVASVETALQYLHTAELHPALRSDSRRYLKDVYYSIDKIEAFKLRCVDKEDQLHRKIGDIASRLKDVKQSIKDAKTERQSLNKQIKDTINNVFNTKVNDLKAEASNRMDGIHEGNFLSRSIFIFQAFDGGVRRKRI